MRRLPINWLIPVPIAYPAANAPTTATPATAMEPAPAVAIPPSEVAANAPPMDVPTALTATPAAGCSAAANAVSPDMAACGPTNMTQSIPPWTRVPTIVLTPSCAFRGTSGCNITSKLVGKLRNRSDDLGVRLVSRSQHVCVRGVGIPRAGYVSHCCSQLPLCWLRQRLPSRFRPPVPVRSALCISGDFGRNIASPAMIHPT